MDTKLPTAPSPDAERLARAEAKLLAGLSRLRPDAPTERLDESPTLSPAQVHWRGPQASWEAAAAGEPASLRYRFGEVFARGGLGTVRRAEDRKLGRTVAIKELMRLDEASVQRFVREAEITARLQHPGIVPLHDLGRDAEGRPFLCMKLVDGDTLEQAIAAAPDLAARLALLRHLIAAADAVAYAHVHGVIHRDLKPANMLVGEFGETVVIDWGLAKDLSQGTDSDIGAPVLPDTISDLTAAGSLLGTLRYMPPEQARGEPVDPRSDVYALGASLFHLVAGKPPFRGRVAATLLTEVLAGDPGPLPAGCPRALAAIVEKAMAIAPADRYAGADAFAEDLRRYTAGGLVLAHDYSLAEIGRLWLHRHRTAASLVAVSLVALTGIGGLSVARISAARAEAVRERQVAVEAGALAEQRASAAEEARARADRATDELRLAQARSALTTDPSAAIGWLAQLGDHAAHAHAARTIALAARAHGLPTRTLHGPRRPIERATVLTDGTIVANEEDGALWRWRPGEALGEEIGPAGDVVHTRDAAHWAVIRDGEVEVHRAGEAVARVATTGRASGVAVVRALATGVMDDLETAPSANLPAAFAGLRHDASDDGRITAALHGRTLLVWADDELHTQALPGPAIGYAQFSDDGTRVLVEIGVATDEVPSLPRKLALWRAGAPLQVVDANAGALVGDTAIYSVDEPTGLRVWAVELATGATRWTRTLTGQHGDWVNLQPSPDGRLVAFHHGDVELALFDARTGAPLPMPASMHMWLGPGGLVISRIGGTLQVRDPLRAPWQPLGPPLASSGVTNSAMAPGGGVLARQRDGGIERVDVARGSVEPMPAGCDDWTRKPRIGLLVGDDGRVVVSDHDKLCLWDAHGVHAVTSPGSLARITFTPDGLRLSSWSDSVGPHEWRPGDLAPHPIGNPGPSLEGIAVDGGRSLAFVGVDGGVRLLGDGAPRELLAPDLDVRWPHLGVAIAPDQRTLAVYKRGASELQLVDVIDGRGGALTGAVYDGPRDPWPRLRFDPSGQHVALLDGGRLTRWSRAEPDAPVSMEVPGVTEIAFTADPRRLAVQTRAGELLLVDPDAGLGVPLRPDQDPDATLGQDPAGGVLLLTGAGELLRWRDDLPAGDALRGWLLTATSAGPR